MSEFSDQYDQLFGGTTKYNPIKPKATAALPMPGAADNIVSRSSALELNFGTPEEKPGRGRLMSYKPPQKTIPEEQSNVGLALQAGVKDIGSLTTGAIEYGARQAETNLDPSVGQEIAGDVRRAAQTARTGYQQEAADLRSQIDPVAQELMARKIFTLDPSQSMFKGGAMEAAKGIGLNLANMAPPSLVTLLGGALLARIGMADKAVAYMSATEAGMSIGGIQNAISDEITKMPSEQLAQESEAYAQFLQEGIPEAQAKEQLIAATQGEIPAIAGITVAAISAVGGRLLIPIFRGEGGNVIQRAGKGFGIEAMQEGPQGGVEQLAQNIAAQAYDKHRSTMAGVPSAVLEEGFYGGVMGGGTSALLGTNTPPAPVTPDQAEIDPAANPPGGALGRRPSTFQRVFGTGGESPFIPPDDPTGGAPAPLPGEPGYAMPNRDDLAAAGQMDMQLYQPGQLDEMSRAAAAGTLRAPMAQQGELDLQQAGTDIQLASPQMDLPLTQREKGVGRQRIPSAVPDVPSAEPASDLAAQMDEMNAGNRSGVYLSPDNVNSAAGDGILRLIDEGAAEGTILENFDGKGGALVVKNADAAERFLEMKRGGLDMQRILGEATGAGTGKPLDPNVVAVQLRDQDGNVVQESAVSEAEAPALAAKWEAQSRDRKSRKKGRDTYESDKYEVVILSTEETQQRREGLISEEAKARTGDLYTGYVPSVDQKRPKQQKLTKTTRTVDKVIPAKVTGYRVTVDGVTSIFRDEKEANKEADAAHRKGQSVTVTPIRFAPRVVATEETTNELAPAAPKVRRSLSERMSQSEEMEDALSEAGADSSISLDTTPAQAAARIIGAAAKQKAAAEQERVGGFYPPKRLNFTNDTYREQYKAAWSDLLENSNIVDRVERKFPDLADIPNRDTAYASPQPMMPMADQLEKYFGARDNAFAAREALGRLRALDKPKLRASNTASAAEQLSPGVTKGVKEELGPKQARSERVARIYGGKETVEEEVRPPTGDSGDYKELAELTLEKIEAIKPNEDDSPEVAERKDKERTRLFYLAATYQSGKSANTSMTYDAGDTNGEKPNNANADEELASYRANAETIPEGAEMVGIATGSSTKGDTRTYELAGVTPSAKDFGGKGKAWTYTMRASDGQEYSMDVRGSKSYVTELAENRIAARNKAAEARRDETNYGLGFDEIITEEVFDKNGVPKGRKLKSPSAQLKLVRRVAEELSKRETNTLNKRRTAKANKEGGKKVSAVLGLASKSKTRTSADGDQRQQATEVFDPQLLYTDETPRDESVADRKTRLAEADEAGQVLTGSLEKAEARLGELAEGVNADLAAETESETGDATQAAADFRMARMYFRQIMSLGQAYLNSSIRTKGTTKQMKKIAAFLDKTASMEADKFSSEMVKLAEAEDREFILAKNAGDDKNLQVLKTQLQDPVKREKLMNKTNDRIRQATVRLFRRSEIWRKNDLYTSSIGPLINKIADSVAKDGYVSYVPTRKELEGVQWALRVFAYKANENIKRSRKIVGNYRDDMYEPIKRFFKDIGYEFDKDGALVIPTDGNVYTNKPTDVMLLQKSQKQFRKIREKDSADAGSAISREPSMSTQYKAFQRQVTAGTEGATRSDIAADISQDANSLRINRVIEEFVARISDPKLTVEGLIRQEQRLIRVLKELKVWQDTPSPVLGKVTHPTTGVAKTISIAGPRLAAKKISKDRARELMAKITPFRLPAINPAYVAPQSEEESSAQFDKRVRRNVQYYRRKVVEAAQEKIKSETDFFLNEIASTKNGKEFEAAAASIYDILNNTTAANGHEVLDAIINALPQGHVYRALAERMRRLTPANIPVSWSNVSGEKTIKDSSYGAFRASNKGGNEIFINYAKHVRAITNTGVDSANASLVHTVLHEMVHATTMSALTDRTVRAAMEAIRTAAIRELKVRGATAMPYGLKDHGKASTDEFVAEAFTNTAFQNELKGMRFDSNKTIWDKIVDYVRDLLGLNTVPTSLFELVMATSNHLFTNTAYVEGKFSELNLGDMDSGVKTLIGGAMGQMVDDARMRGVLKAGQWAGVRAPLSLMTLTQIRNEFKDRLTGLDQYYRSFKRRDARNAELLEEATKISQEWTKLTERDGAVVATEFSWIATSATVHSVDPTVPITDPANKHVKDPAQKDTHAELQKAFQALPDDWKAHWKHVQKYYRESLDRETLLLTQNALRAVLTKGADPIMDIADFEKEFDIEQVKQLNTAKALMDQLGDRLDPEMIATITSMRTIPMKRTGPYFPIMRYGEFVVRAERKLKPKMFSSSEEAKTWRDAQVAEDPTLEITLRLKDNGGVEASIVEKAFLLAESATEAQLKRDELVQEYGEENVSAIKKKLDYGTASTIQSNDALGRILEQLEGNTAAQSAVRQYYLRSLADSSFRKHEIKRKNRRGYDSKLQHRNFTNHAQSSSYYTAQLEFGWKMAAAMDEMRKGIDKQTGPGREGVRMSEVYKSIADRDKKSSDPAEINKMIRKTVGFTQMWMLTSPAYNVINSTQPYMVSLPYMSARHGFGQTISALGHAQKLIIHPLVGQAWNSKAGLAAFWSKTKTEEAYNVLDDVKQSILKRVDGAAGQDLVDMLDELRRESILDLSWAAELRDISEGTDTGIGQRTIDASRILSHLTEVNNRILTAIAAYNLEITASGDKIKAVEYAKDVVASTHFDYSSGAKPLMFRPDGPLGAMAPLVFQFMQWPQHMYAMLISNMIKAFKAEGMEKKEAARIVFGLLGTHLLAAGIIGTALQPIKWAIGFAMMALGDDDDPTDAKSVLSGAAVDRVIQEQLASLLGPSIAAALARGLPSAVGLDMSSRMSMGTLYFMDIRPETMESTLGSVAMSMGGAWLSLASNGWRAMADIANGDIGMAAERLSPKVIKDVLKTYRYASEGLVNSAGDTVLEAERMSPYELFLQSLGFSSSTVSNTYQRQSVIKDVEMFAKDRKQELIKDYLDAESPEDRADVVKEIVEFRKRYPGENITMSTLLQATRGSKEREASYKRYGANLRGKNARKYADEGWYLK